MYGFRATPALCDSLIAPVKQAAYAIAPRGVALPVIRLAHDEMPLMLGFVTGNCLWSAFHPAPQDGL